MTKPAKKSKEIQRHQLFLAKVFQNLAYICLFIGGLALIAVITGLIMAFWPRPDAGLGGNVSSGSDYGWGGIPALVYSFLMFNPFVIILEIAIVILGIMIIIWGWKLAVRTTRRLTWRLADALMKPLAMIEPLVLLIIWTLVMLGIWFGVDPQFFWVADLTSLSFLIVGLINFFAMRKLAGDVLDFTRIELMLGHRWRAR